MDFFFLLNAWEKNQEIMSYNWVYACLSHFALCEMTVLNNINGISPWVSAYISPMPGAGSFSLATHQTLF